MGGATTATVDAMPTALRQPLAPITQLVAEWQAIGRSRAAVDALHAVADRDPVIADLVHGADGRSPSCPSPLELVDHMRQANSRGQREEAARIVRVLLREEAVHPFVSRTLVQALLPGLLSVAKRLQWGAGGEWGDSEEFFGEVLSTTWVTIDAWSGQDRPYAVLDLLSAIRCRLRRQLLHAKEQQFRQRPFTWDITSRLEVRPETDLEELSRLLIDLHGRGLRTDEAQVLYAHHVLGYSISELATVTGRERRSLYVRRDRGQRRLCA
jgi:hypothetical protein